MRFSINTTTTWTCSLIKADLQGESRKKDETSLLNSKLISGADSWLTRQNGFLMWITKWQQDKINENDILSKLFWSLNMRTYYCYSCLKVIEYPHCFNLLLVRYFYDQPHLKVLSNKSSSHMNFLKLWFYVHMKLKKLLKNTLPWKAPTKSLFPGIRPCCQSPCPLPWAPCHRWLVIVSPLFNFAILWICYVAHSCSAIDHSYVSCQKYRKFDKTLKYILQGWHPGFWSRSTFTSQHHLHHYL